ISGSYKLKSTAKLNQYLDKESGSLLRTHIPTVIVVVFLEMYLFLNFTMIEGKIIFGLNPRATSSI
ncbi:hypothetical protein TorRG33x02_262720, partial [Trema orientale]